MSIRVSFIIPSLNQGRYIARCIDSCLGQGLDDFEVLVQDGGSTDETVSVLNGYGERVDWVSEEDDGQSNAINSAIRRATGDVIAWINSDDFYATRVLPQVIETMLTQTADVVVGHAAFIDVDGKVIRQYKADLTPTPMKSLLINPTSPVAQPSVLFRRNVYERIGGLRDDLHWAMDHELWFRMFKPPTRVVEVDTLLSYQTLHADAKSVRGVRRQIREIEEIKREHGASLSLTWTERIRKHCGRAKLEFYAFAMRMNVAILLSRVIAFFSRR